MTSKEIAERLAEAGHEIDKKKIVLKEPIKTPDNIFKITDCVAVVWANLSVAQVTI